MWHAYAAKGLAVDGIFLDEVTNTEEGVSTYQGYSDYIKR
jgi:hypothetical protein